jgi:catechol 2,3-dioxygenase-like lactoylglutathione lyase family enzyme
MIDRNGVSDGIVGFSHVQLVVRDLDRSANWYAKVLGMVEFVRGTTATGGYVGMKHPTARFVIGMQEATSTQVAGLGSSAIDHLSFAVADRVALERARSAILDAGFDVGEIFEEAISHNLRLVDPDGLVLELTAPK